MAYDTILIDTHGAFNTSTGLYTCPVSGDYHVTTSHQLGASPTNIKIAKNGVAYTQVVDITSSGNNFAGSASIPCVAGDTLAVWLGTGRAFNVGSAPYTCTASFECLAGSAGVSDDGRVVAFSADTATTSYTANTPVVFTSNVKDSHGAYNASTGRYTAPISGWYDVAGSVYATSPGGGSSAYIYKNGSQYSQSGLALNTSGGTNIFDLLFLLAGDIVDLRINVSNTLTNSANTRLNRFTVSRRTGSAASNANDSIGARYHTGSASITGTDSTVTYTAKDFDSHNAYSGGTYTVPASGKYQISAALVVSATGTFSTTISIYKNGVQFSQIPGGGGIVQASGNNLYTMISDQVPLLAGDLLTIRIRSTGTSPTITAVTESNYFAIAKVGN